MSFKKNSKILNIGNLEVSYDKPPLIIAEIGINHSGSIDIAKKLADLAADNEDEQAALALLLKAPMSNPNNEFILFS